MTRTARKTTPKPRPIPVATVKPNPVAYAAALKLAEGNRTRIVVRSETELVVVNHL